MTEAKISFQLGQLSFSGEGSENWVARQVDLIISRLPQLSLSAPMLPAHVKDPLENQDQVEAHHVGSLSSHIKAKGGESLQTRRFLATADWLRCRGEKNLKTGLIASALRDHHQKKLSNPSESLNKNVTQGLCEKANGGFFITPEGLKVLGY